MTIAFSRKGKEAIILGKEAKPTVSKMVSRSDDVEIKSVTDFQIHAAILKRIEICLITIIGVLTE